jgi:hypothetical protein
MRAIGRLVMLCYDLGGEKVAQRKFVVITSVANNSAVSLLIGAHNAVECSLASMGKG